MDRKDYLTFTVSVPTVDGFVARECNSTTCGRYFKVHESSLADQMHCPYCGERFHKNDLFTEQQAKHVEALAVEKAKEEVFGQIDKMFGKMSRQFRGGPITVKHKPMRYRARHISATYRDQDVDSELVCPVCDTQFQVFGIFGFCPGCATENLQIYDANIAIVRQEISSASDKNRALRHAYSDLVSTFESFCRKSVPSELKSTNFQDLFDTRRALRAHCGVDILEGIDAEDLLALRRVFQKRHVHVHNNGKISERYVRKIPEDLALLNMTATLSMDEFEVAASALRTVIDQVVATRNLGKA